jgi:hypothetical protein
MGFAGMSVDVGYLEYWQQKQQNATDAAAIGGAEVLARSNCASAASAQSAAVADAQENGFNNAGNTTVTAVSPPTSGPYSGNSCAVSVQIQTQHVTTWFSRLFGYPNGMTESTQAVGTINANGGACIYLLSTNSWSSFSGANLDAPGCAIAINYTADFNSGSITSPSIGYAGGSPNYGSMTFPMAAPAPMLPVADPCSQIPGCAYLTSNPPPTNCSSGLNTSGNQTISPGCYQYLNFQSGTTITMRPGLYVLDQMNTNGATVTGSGVTLYIPSGANGANFDNQTVTLSAPTSGNYANVLYYQVPGNSSSINFNGPNVSASGLIYAPSSTSVNFDEGVSTYAVLVFGSMNFNGPNAMDLATPAPGQSLIKQAVLGE